MGGIISVLVPFVAALHAGEEQGRGLIGWSGLSLLVVGFLVTAHGAEGMRHGQLLCLLALLNDF